MPKEKEQPVVHGRSTTELRVVITEDGQGKLDVEWQAIVKNTEISIPMRPSHVIGQLQAAALIIATQSYTGLRDKFSGTGNSKSKE